MKKLFVFLVAVLISAVAFSQALIPAFTYKNANSKFSKQLKEGSIVYLADSNMYYGLTAVSGASRTMADVIDSTDFVPLYALDATGENLILSGYLMVGSQKITQSTVNRANINNSFGVGDTLFTAVVSATGNITSAATVYGAVGDFTGTWTDYIYMGSEDTTIGNQVGRIVYQASDSTWYGCRSTTAAKKWYALN